MSDELKLDLAREIYPDSKRARKESFSATQWAGVERAWAWVTLNFQPSNPDTYLNEFLREKLRTEISVHDAIHESVQQPKELTVKQEPAPSPAPAGVPVDRECCVMCFHKSGAKSWERTMIVCPDCGNKRCPKATNHVNACTGSNEPGQSGSLYVDDGSFNVAPALRTRDERIADLERRLGETRTTDFGPARDMSDAEKVGELRRSLADMRERTDATIATLTKERDEARAQNDDNGDVFTEHCNAIAKLCGCETWEYPGQVIRDVELVVKQRDAALARVAEREGLVHFLKMDCETLRTRVAELEKRGASVWISKLYNEHGISLGVIGPDGKVLHTETICWEAININAPIAFFGSPKALYGIPRVRRITMEELERLGHEWLDQEPSIQDRLVTALRAIGFEVEA